ncbi:hypothetical protein QBC34DRAFT_383359 [Podospora aff. communis PSN243]|uniref:Uncharacterized protein n=1 Tax=Podospora aff. communis PSN243 TaxID=3040156 RepID=A0AAV9GED0_9PEZI|nr:hypothetical protein QBC34DRAFT_383359 [Podospora aff. communis PSN243]
MGQEHLASSLRGKLSRLPMMKKTSEKASEAPQVEHKSRLPFLRRKTAAAAATATATATSSVTATFQSGVAADASVSITKETAPNLNDVAIDSGPSILAEFSESLKTQLSGDSADPASIAVEVLKSPSETNVTESRSAQKLDATINESIAKTASSTIPSIEEEPECAPSPFRRGRGAFYNPGSRKDESFRNRTSRRLSTLNPAYTEALDLSKSQSLPTTLGSSARSGSNTSSKPHITPATTLGSVIVECDARDIFANFPVCLGTTHSLEVNDVKQHESTPIRANSQVECASSPFMVTPLSAAAKERVVIKLTLSKAPQEVSSSRVPSNGSSNKSEWTTTNDTVGSDSIVDDEDMTFMIPHITYDDTHVDAIYKVAALHNDSAESSALLDADSSIMDAEDLSYIDPTNVHLPNSSPVRIYHRRETPYKGLETPLTNRKTDTLYLSPGHPKWKTPEHMMINTPIIMSDPFLASSPAPVAPKATPREEVPAGKPKRRHTLTRKFLSALRHKPRPSLMSEINSLFISPPHIPNSPPNSSISPPHNTHNTHPPGYHNPNNPPFHDPYTPSYSRPAQTFPVWAPIETFYSPDCYSLGMHYVLGNDLEVYWQYVETDQFCKLGELDFAVFVSLYPDYLKVVKGYEGGGCGEEGWGGEAEEESEEEVRGVEEEEERGVEEESEEEVRESSLVVEVESSGVV